MLQVPGRVGLVLVGDRQDHVVVVEVARDHSANGLRVVRNCLSRRACRGVRTSATTGATSPSRWLRLELVGNDRGWMPGLRVQANVEATVRAAGDVHVDVLQQLRHLRDEDLPATLRLNELE